jgi:hypothetical protein
MDQQLLPSTEDSDTGLHEKLLTSKITGSIKGFVKLE